MKIRQSKTRLLTERKLSLRAEVQSLENKLAAARQALSDAEIAERVLASLEGWSLPKDTAERTPAQGRIDAVVPPIRPRKGTTREMILSAMPVGREMSKQAILDALKLVADLNESSVGVELSRMVNAGLLSSNKRGVYARKDKGLAM
jgi:hypothetical protein